MDAMKKIARAGAAALGLALASCAAAPTPRGIGLDLASYMRLIRDEPLSVRCQAVRDAQERCRRGGFPADCAWNGWAELRRSWMDVQDDDWTIRACMSRAAAGVE